MHHAPLGGDAAANVKWFARVVVQRVSRRRTSTLGKKKKKIDRPPLTFFGEAEEVGPRTLSPFIFIV